MKANCCLLALLCLGGMALADETPKDMATYQELLKQVKESSPKADFLKLRMAFTETAAYNPYDSDVMAKQEMAEALDNKEYEKALKLAEKALANRYVDINAHSVAARACEGLKKTEQAEFHRKVHDGLIQSILKSGDGKNQESAYAVIFVDEEYAVLGHLGIRRTQQALVGDKGQKFDRIVGVDKKSNERITLYFNVTRQFNWLADQLKKGK